MALYIGADFAVSFPDSACNSVGSLSKYTFGLTVVSDPTVKLLIFPLSLTFIRKSLSLILAINTGSESPVPVVLTFFISLCIRFIVHKELLLAFTSSTFFPASKV